MGKSSKKKANNGKNDPPPKDSKLVKAANAVKNPISEFPSYRTFTSSNGEVFTLNYAKSGQLSKEELEWVVDLTERNMRKLYETSSWGWNRGDKQEELHHVSAKYVIVRMAPSSPESTSQLVAFAHFRFVMDEDFPVLYVYELQCEPPFQRLGLGSFLMNLFAEVAAKYSMNKIVLTVLKHNESAWDFYVKKLGYKVDPSSPSCYGISETYEILSKTC